MSVNSKNLNIFFSAGERSGELLAASLYKEMKKIFPSFQAWGVCGPEMEKVGIEKYFSIDELSVMGFSAVLKKIHKIKRLENNIIERIERKTPKLAIFFDAPSFHLRISEQLKLRKIRCVHYVAPQVWAWRPKRALSLKDKTDLILGILPFEKEFFSNYNVPFKFIGSPVHERIQNIPLERKKEKPYSILFLPGSRHDEVINHLPLILDVITKIREKSKHYNFTVSLAPSISSEVFKKFLNLKDNNNKSNDQCNLESFVWRDIVFSRKNSLELMSKANFSLVKSGTSTLECALLECPLAVFYKTHPINFFIAKKLMTIPFISLPNIIANKEIIKEFIQNFSTEEIVDHIIEHCESEKGMKIKQDLKSLKNLLPPDASKKAARILKNFI